MTQLRGRVYASRGPVPLWLVLAVLAPLGLVFLTSLILAVAVVGVAASLAAFVLPLFSKRRTSGELRTEPSNTIELDRSQYHQIGDERRGPRDE